MRLDLARAPALPHNVLALPLRSRGTSMTIEVVSFIIGGILVATAIVGGGFEIKEIKMPRVGAAVRVVSLVVGSGFLLLAMGIWGLNNPQLIADNPPTNALAPGNAAAHDEVREPRERSVTQQQPPEQTPVVYPEPQAAAEPGFSGFTGDTYLTWQIEGVSVSASARFSGMSGIIRIGWTDPASGVREEVLEDLVLQQGADGTLFYQGANARDASTEVLRAEYNPDQFRVVRSDSDQGWTIDQICDVQGCWPVYVQ